MGFANLSLLGIGLALLSVPLLLLLINRKRQIIPWAAYYWMALAAQKKKKRVRVTEWLKLFSKLLLVLAAALFMARPFLGLGSQGHTLVIVDRSLSMTTLNGNETRLDAARERASTVIRETPGQITLASFDGELNILARGQTDVSALERLLQGIQPAAGAGTGRELTDALLGLENLDQYATVVVIGDFQRVHYGDGAVQGDLDSRLPDGVRATFLPVDDRTGLGNLALTDWKLAPEGLHAGRDNTMMVRVQNFGEAPVEQVPVTLALDGEDMDRAYVDLAPGEAAWAYLSCPLLDATPRELTISLQPDDYTLDDTLSIMLAPPAKRNVLTIAYEAPAEARYPLDVFVRSALLAVGGQTAWNYRAVTPLQALHEDFANYDLVILLGTPLRPEDPLTKLVRDHLASGRGAISFADPAVPAFWSGLALEHGEAMLAERAVDGQRLAGGYLEFLQAEGMSAKQIHTFQAVPLPGTPESEARLYVDDAAAPVIRAMPLERGTLVAVGFLPAPGHTDLYYNPNFVQFMQRMAWEAMGLQPALGPIGQQLAAVKVPDLSLNHRYAWGAEGQPSQQVALLDDLEQPRLDLEPPATGGFYTITADDADLLRLGYNPTRADSDIGPAGDRLRQNATARVQVSAAGADAGGATRELAWLGILALMLALVFEFYAHLVHRT